MLRKLITILLLTLLYVLLRYVFFGPASLARLPVYLFNKALAMSSVIYLLLAAAAYRQQLAEKLKFWGTASFHTAMVHIFLSLTILSKNYYPRFFDIEKMTAAGELTILSGILSGYFYWTSRNGNSFFGRTGVLRMLAVLAVAAHLLAMGVTGWLQVADWFGYLPPVSLISFILVSMSLILFIRKRKI